MEHKSLEFLKELVEAHGASGYEEGVQAIFRRRVSELGAEVRTDLMGSVVAALNPGGAPRILLDGHADEIGFLVKYIDDKGFLYVDRIGGWDTEVVVAQRVWVHTEAGPIPGCFGKKAIHLMDEDERKKRSDLQKMWVDIGARDGAEARAQVAIGDSVTLQAVFTPLGQGLAMAKAFDNRAGIFAVAETLRLLQGRTFEGSVHGVSAVQEEIGLRGARTAAYGIDPLIGIAIDVCHTSDYPDTDKRKTGDLSLGGGPVICRGPNMSPAVVRRLVEVARREGIPYQLQASGGGTGTDANVIQLSRSGVATGLISIPLRYMHSPCETAALADLENTARLLAAFVESVKAEDHWIPGL